ncbi:MAG: bifunctional oligoribonuclease/PAP phosphatase NrnA [Clostridia bacterium]|nr:bifunctional oligoribonuclease/PAP phosphatase NrnA [Clostridia bacterium]
MNILNFLLSKRSVLLLPHVNPDWDAYGSCLALRHILRERGVSCDILLDEPVPFHLNFLDTDALVYDENEEYKYDVICAVDGSELSRFSKRAALFEKIPEHACIDHHVCPAPFTPMSIINPNAAATAEVIYDLMRECGIPLSPKLAEYLYCALSSDTGSFRHSNTTAHSAQMLSDLLSAGLDIGALSNMLYFRSTLSQLKLRAAAIETLELFAEGTVGICTISRQMLADTGATRDDAGALSDLPRSVYTVRASAVLKEEDNGTVKLSLRSNGDINVLQIAALFGGGGHVPAAGATVEGTLSEIKERLIPHLVKAVQS